MKIDFWAPVITLIFTVAVCVAVTVRHPETWSNDIHNCSGTCYENMLKSGIK